MKPTRTTLDNLHHIQVGNLQREKEEVDNMTIKLEILKKRIEACADVVEKTKLEDEYDNLKKKRDDWRENKPMYDYFFETGEILYKYYDLQEKIQQGSTGSSKAVKVKPGSVLAALNEGIVETPFVPQQRGFKQEEGREVLLEK